MSGWSTGSYEHTAARLQPAADVLIGVLDPVPGARVLDVATGTGNAALAAARRGAQVVGLDAAERLVDVARERAAGDGLEAEFVVGDATALPFGDNAFDAAISVFGVIFAHPEPAAAELLRVVRPGGRILFTAWCPGGATGRVVDLMREALGAPTDPPPWSSPDYVRDLFAPQPVAITEHEIGFTAASAAEYVAELIDHHPLWRNAAPKLAESGRLDDLTAATLAVYEDANEDPAAFRTSSRYLLVSVSPA